MTSKTIRKLRIVSLLTGAGLTSAGAVYFAFFTHDVAADRKAGYLALFALLVTLIVDQVILLFSRDIEEVMTELELLQHRLGLDVAEPEAIRALERLRNKPLHHYHLTTNRDGDFIWSYKLLTFGGPPSAGKLTCVASFLPSLGADAKDHEYQIEASLDRSHLVMRTRRVDGSPDIGIEVFRAFAARSTANLFPLYGVKILTTWWDDQLASSISILNDAPLVKDVKSGAPITGVDALQTDWEKWSGIVRLPAAPTLKQGITTAKPGEAITQKWNEDSLIEMLQNSPHDADIRIFVSFFVNDVDLFRLLMKLLTNSKRSVTIMMLDPDAPVLEMRYGTEAQPIRGTLTASSARAKIAAQLHDLAELKKGLRRSAEDAERNKRHQDTGAIEVRLYRCAPTLVSYQTPDEMLVGMLFLHDSANAGPMIKIKKNEPMWRVIEDNWETVFDLSKVPQENY